MQRATTMLAMGVAIWGIGRDGPGSDDRAIADLDEAIRLEPKYAAAYSSRGSFREASGDLVGAKADFAESARLERLTIEQGTGSRGR